MKLSQIKKFLKRLGLGFLGFIFISFLVWIIILRMNYVVPIFMYHSVCEGGKRNCRLIVEPDYFDKQMKFLHDHHYNVVYVYEIAEMIKNKKKIPPKTVAITFDDAYENNYTKVFPILKKYNIPATIFVIVDYINTENYMSIDQLREISEAGVDIGSHTMSHLWLPNSDDPDRWRREIVQSKKALEALLGKEVKSFSYPGGAFNDEIKKIPEEAGYKVAVATSPGPDFPNDDPYALKRLRISNTSRNLFVYWFKLTGSYLFIKERRDDY